MQKWNLIFKFIFSMVCNHIKQQQQKIIVFSLLYDLFIATEEAFSTDCYVAAAKNIQTKYSLKKVFFTF